MTTPNKQNDKRSNGVKQTPNKNREGAITGQSPNEDYDYRPDFGKTGGGAEHNPELKTDAVQHPSKKPADKPEKAK
jgi:hypothetical protein